MNWEPRGAVFITVVFFFLFFFFISVISSLVLCLRRVSISGEKEWIKKRTVDLGMVYVFYKWFDGEKNPKFKRRLCYQIEIRRRIIPSFVLITIEFYMDSMAILLLFLDWLLAFVWFTHSVVQGFESFHFVRWIPSPNFLLCVDNSSADTYLQLKISSTFITISLISVYRFVQMYSHIYISVWMMNIHTKIQKQTK